MIHLTSDSVIMLANKAVDFRKGIDSLAGLCENELRENPRSGKLFVFCSKDKTKVRILVYERNGYWLMTKRLSSGSFKMLRSGNISASELRNLCQ